MKGGRTFEWRVFSALLVLLDACTHNLSTGSQLVQQNTLCMTRQTRQTRATLYMPPCVRFVAAWAAILCCVAFCANGQGGCSAAARDYYAMTFCAECEVINGVPVASDRPTRRVNQTCVSPCLQPIPRPCIYLERPWLLGNVDISGQDRTSDPWQEQNFLRARCVYTRTSLECTSNSSRIDPFWSPFETVCPDYGGTLVSSGQTLFPFGSNNKTLVPGAIPYCRFGYYLFLAMSSGDPLAHPFCYLPLNAVPNRPVLAPLGPVVSYDFYVTLNSTDPNGQFARIGFDMTYDIDFPPSPTPSGGFGAVVCFSASIFIPDKLDCSSSAVFLHTFPAIANPTWNDVFVGPIMPARQTPMYYTLGGFAIQALSPADELRAFFPRALVLRTHEPSLFGARTAFGVAQETVRVLNQPLSAGLCAGRRCVGSTTSIGDLAVLNPTNDPCAASSCESRLTDAALALPVFDPALASLWPNPACTAISPGFPRCTSLNTSYPSLEFALSYIVAANLSGALRDGDACYADSSCVSESFCLNKKCTPAKTGTASCELFTCRECSPYGGTCTGPPVLEGSTCFRGCLDFDRGTCTATQACVGTPITGASCAASQGIFLPNVTTNGDCYLANCVVLPSFMETNRSTYLAPQYGTTGIPITFEAARLIVEDILLGTGGLTECTLSYALPGDPCNDANACTNSTECDGLGTCEPLTSFESWCLNTACASCNPATGLCTGTQAPDFLDCITACGDGATPWRGVCESGFCVSTAGRDPAVCRDFALEGYCNTTSCKTKINGRPIAQAANVLFDLDVLAPLANRSAVCNTTKLPDGETCFAASLSGDRCVVQEFCQAGFCSNVERFNCSQAIAQSTQCGNTTTAKCNPLSGACEAVPVRNGTACNDGNLCTTGDACFTFPSFPDEGICVPGPSIPCTTGGNPCIESATCDATTGQCVLTPVVNGRVCSLGVPFTGVCPQNGTCVGGLCVPPPGVCPVLNAVCAAAGCNATTGNCTVLNRPDNIGCNDGNQCTLFDKCTSGVCGGTAVSCLPVPTDCFALGNPICFPSTGCNYVPRPTGATCQGGRGRCDGVGTCVCQRVCLQGVCVYEALNGTSCACFPDYTGANCEIFAPLVTSTSITDFIDDVRDSVSDFASDNILYGIFALLAVFGLALCLVTLCRPSVQPVQIRYAASASDDALGRLSQMTPEQTQSDAR